MLSAAELQRRLDARQSMSSLAEELGVTREAIVYRVRVLGLKRPPPAKSVKLGKLRPPLPVAMHAKPASSRRTTRRQCITCNEPFLSTGPDIACARPAGTKPKSRSTALETPRNEHRNRRLSVHRHRDHPEL